MDILTVDQPAVKPFDTFYARMDVPDLNLEDNGDALFATVKRKAGSPQGAARPPAPVTELERMDADLDALRSDAAQPIITMSAGTQALITAEHIGAHESTHPYLY